MFTVTKNFGRSFSPVTLVLEPFFRCSQARPAGAIGDAFLAVLLGRTGRDPWDDTPVSFDRPAQKLKMHKNSASETRFRPPRILQIGCFEAKLIQPSNGKIREARLNSFRFLSAKRCRGRLRFSQ